MRTCCSTEREVLLQHLQGLAAQTGTDTGLNVVACTGCVKDAIVAAILESSFEERTVLCMVADGMSRQQQLHAELTADLLGGQLNDMPKSSCCSPFAEAAKRTTLRRGPHALHLCLQALSYGRCQHKLVVRAQSRPWQLHSAQLQIACCFAEHQHQICVLGFQLVG